MNLTVIRSEEAFGRMSESWNRLLHRSVSDIPFLRHEYLTAWWSNLGGGEWEEGELWVATALDSSGELLGAAPFRYGKTLDGKLGMMFIGSIEISDYLDLLVSCDDLELFVEALFSMLENEVSSPWEVLDLYNILEGSPTLAALRKQAAKHGWRMSEERLDPCPMIPLGNDWESYLAGLSKKQRHEMRRKMRRADEHPVEVRYRSLEGDKDPEADIGIFMEMMAQDPLKTEFLTDAMDTQFRRIMRAGHENGWLQLSFIEVGGDPAAAYLNFDYGDRLWIYNSTISKTHMSLSPGWVLMGKLIQWAIENGRTGIDFMRGDEQYKYRLGGVDRYIRRLTISR